MPAEIKMPFEEFATLQRQIGEATEKITQLERRLIEAKTADPEVAKLTQLVRSSLEIVTFATANLSPEIIKRWPYQALRTIAAFMPSLPDHTVQDVELAAELVKIANECELWERKRASTFERYVPPPPPNGIPSGGFGYQAGTATPKAVAAATLAGEIDRDLKLENTAIDKRPIEVDKIVASDGTIVSQS